MKHNPLLEGRDTVNRLAVVCGCLETARIGADYCFAERMLEGARNLLADVFIDCVAVEEVEAARACAEQEGVHQTAAGEAKDSKLAPIRGKTKRAERA